MTRKPETGDPDDWIRVYVGGSSQDVPLPSEQQAQADTCHEEYERPQKRSSYYAPDNEGHEQFWIVCRCTKCANEEKPHVRLYDTVLHHLRLFQIADKFKDEYLDGLRRSGHEHFIPGSSARDIPQEPQKIWAQSNPTMIVLNLNLGVWMIIC